MKKQQRLSVLLALGLAVACSPMANAGRVISTFDPGGADAEVREAALTTRFGASTELGMRVAIATNPPGGNHNGHAYMKFGVSSVTLAELAGPITVRTSWRTNNLGNNRIEDVLDLDNAQFANRPNVAFDYYVLDPNNAGADWNESLIAYRSSAPTTVPDPDTGDPIPGGANPNGTVAAPGLIPPAPGDPANFATKDLSIGPGQLTYLGTKQLRSLARNGSGPGSAPIESPNIPVGEDFDLTVNPGSPLHNAIIAAMATSHQTVTVVATLAHDNSTNPNPGWQNHNYVWTPKEMATMLNHSNYDSDTTNPDNPLGSPHSLAANTQANPYAPRLAFIPEPGSVLLAGVSALSLLVRRRMA
jgi:hypothetical protein